MGFVIDMISGEIQQDSSAIENRFKAEENTSTELFDVYQPLPRIQEYTQIEEVTHKIPESILDVDVDSFIDQM